ncbi:MAG: SAF domain-containing protein [Promethearchaeota archaeon]
MLLKAVQLISTDYVPIEEIARKNARRSIVANKDIEMGEIIEETNIMCKRPGFGISPVFWEELLKNKKVKAKRDIKDDEIITWDDISF